jgi:hypothetical protein
VASPKSGWLSTRVSIVPTSAVLRGGKKIPQWTSWIVWRRPSPCIFPNYSPNHQRAQYHQSRCEAADAVAVTRSQPGSTRRIVLLFRRRLERALAFGVPGPSVKHFVAYQNSDVEGRFNGGRPVSVPLGPPAHTTAPVVSRPIGRAHGCEPQSIESRE